MQVVKSGREYATDDGQALRTESVIASVREAEAGLRRVADREAAHSAQD